MWLATEGSAWFRCVECQAVFKLKHLMVRHLKQRHGHVDRPEWELDNNDEKCARWWERVRVIEGNKIVPLEKPGSNGTTGTPTTSNNNVLGNWQNTTSTSTSSSSPSPLLLLPEEAKKFKCDLCLPKEMWFAFKKSLYAHLLKNHDRGVCKVPGVNLCRFCGFKADSLSGLKLHIRTHTGESGEDPPNLVECSGHCGRVFSSKASMKKHVRFKCPEAKKQQGSSGGVASVTSSVVGGVGGVGVQGDSSCSSSAEDIQPKINVHVLRQSATDLPFKCPQCVETFPTQARLHGHMTVHSGSLYHCRFCGAPFAHVHTRGAHETNAHNEELGFGYKCPVCSKNFANIATIRGHYKYTHWLDLPPREEIESWRIGRLEELEEQGAEVEVETEGVELGVIETEPEPIQTQTHQIVEIQNHQNHQQEIPHQIQITQGHGQPTQIIRIQVRPEDLHRLQTGDGTEQIQILQIHTTPVPVSTTTTHHQHSNHIQIQPVQHQQTIQLHQGTQQQQQPTEIHIQQPQQNQTQQQQQPQFHVQPVQVSMRMGVGVPQVTMGALIGHIPVGQITTAPTPLTTPAKKELLQIQPPPPQPPTNSTRKRAGSPTKGSKTSPKTKMAKKTTNNSTDGGNSTQASLSTLIITPPTTTPTTSTTTSTQKNTSPEPRRKFHCRKPSCDGKFQRRWELTWHLEKAHGEFSCEFCSAVTPFATKGELLNHQYQIHHREMGCYECRICGKELESPRGVQEHVVEDHPGTEVPLTLEAKMWRRGTIHRKRVQRKGKEDGGQT